MFRQQNVSGNCWLRIRERLLRTACDQTTSVCDNFRVNKLCLCSWFEILKFSIRICSVETIYELQCFFTKGELQREPMLMKVWEPLLYYMRDSDIDVLSDTIFEQCASWPAEMCNAAFVRNVPEALFHLCKCLVNFYPLVVCNNSISWNLWLKSGHLGEN